MNQGSYREQMYDGVQRDAAPVPGAPMPNTNVMTERVAKGMKQVAANLGGFFARGVKMEDAKNEFEAERLLMEVNIETRNDLRKMINTPDGKPGSMFDDQGAVRQETLMNLGDKVSSRLAGIGQNIIDPERRAKVQQKADTESLKLLDAIGETWETESRRKTETIFKDTFELAVARGDYDTASGLADRGAEMGLFSKARADVMKVNLEQTRERKRLAALKAVGKSIDGRMITAELMRSLKQAPVQDTRVDTSGLESAEFDHQGMQTLKNPGLSVLPPDELMDGFNVAQRLADSGAITVTPEIGLMEVKLPPSPGESTQKVAGVAQAFNGYSLEDYRKSIIKVAAGYMADEQLSGLSGDKLVSDLMNEVQLDGAEDAWFGGDTLAYKGWLQTELSRILVVRGSGAARAADRIMSGDEGRAGLKALLEQEVTQEEISTLGYGFNAVGAITKGGLRDEKDVLVPEFWSAVKEYELHRDRWRQELKSKGSKYKPSSEDDVAKAYKKDWREFGSWYMKQGDLYKTRREALEEGVRDVYLQRAVDAVAELRVTGSFQLGTEEVQLDGKSDWAQEEKVIRHVLRQPLSEQELGTAKALAATKEKLYVKRKEQAATYAIDLERHKASLKGKQQSITDEKARKDAEKKADEELENVLAQADSERLSGYSRRVERKVTYGSVATADGEQEPAVVVIPRAMYAEAADALGAREGGFYAFVPGVKDGIPVMAGDVKTVQFNAPVLNLLDGKKNKLTGQQLRALSNDGLMVPVQFSAFQKF